MFLESLKQIPVDLGQGNLRTKTKGKLIAQEYIAEDGNGLSALDVGCREGHQSELLKERGYHVKSIDIEKTYDDCIVMDANKPLDFENECFDLVWCSEVIEHLEDPIAFAYEVRRVLKNGGQLLLTTPNSCFWLYKIFGLFGVSPKQMQNPTHLHFFHIEDIKRIFPEGELFGFFPYFLLKCKISKCINALSPTFVVRMTKTRA